MVKHSAIMKRKNSTTNNSTAEWLSDPVAAHEKWRKSLLVADRPYADHSTALYISLFGVFCRWMAQHGLNLSRVTTVDLAGFLDELVGRRGLPASPRTRRSYLAEIDRVLTHLQALGLRQDEPTRDLLNMLKITTPLKARSIFVARPDTRFHFVSAISALSPADCSLEVVRAYAMVMLMLDAGLTDKEMQKVTLRHIRQAGGGPGEKWIIDAPGHRMLQPRSIELSEQAGRWLQAWLGLRSKLRLITPAQAKSWAMAEPEQRCRLLEGFLTEPPPADHLSKLFVIRAGRQGQKAGLRQAGFAINRMRVETIYAAAVLAFEMVDARLGIVLGAHEKRFRGPQTLRNLYGAGLLADGRSDQEVMYQMGLMALDQVTAIRRSMPGLNEGGRSRRKLSTESVN